ncbi:TonB family protein [Sphingomicrobium flavum]|uniref:TonB family protein n=1 Tax=Sphingomicrobium flavum TaxID=1229164 RepID=UPI0021ADA2E9|nr:TonB family protein [Sphingomicrobium flavum]
MAYSPSSDGKTRVGTLILVLALHGVVLAAVMILGGKAPELLPDEVLETFDVSIAEPPPPVEVDIDTPDEATPRDEGLASEENLESDATPVEAPKPKVETPPVNPIVASPTPNVGSDATQGASDRAGAGTGAGGQGTGTGAGAGGDGKGGGGGTRPRVVQSTTLTQRDYPRAMRRDWPRGGRVLVSINVQVDGRATDCKVRQSIGDPAIDAETCRLVEQKVRFQPARDANGNPYVAWYGYVQTDVSR